MSSEITESTCHIKKAEVSEAATVTIQQVLILISSILIIVVVLQIPTILYYNDQPSRAESFIPTFGINFETCSVSPVKLRRCTGCTPAVHWLHAAGAITHIYTPDDIAIDT